MKKLLIWTATALALFACVVSGALTASMRALTAVIDGVDWALTGKLIGTYIVWWWQGEVAKLMFWANLFS